MESKEAPRALEALLAVALFALANGASWLPAQAGELAQDTACVIRVDCDDGNGCTDDECDPVVGCVHEANSMPCDDGNACSADELCSAGTCGGVRADNAVSAGVYSVCAIRVDGRLACWGMDSGGNIDGPDIGLSRYLAVADGYAHACALRRDRRLECWGLDASGSVTGPRTSIERYVDVRVGNSHTCALRTDGRLACWGESSYGQVSGPNESTDRYKQLAAGGYGTCAVRVDGRLRCWGPNARAQTSGPNASVDRYVSVALSYFHTCALRLDGKLVCWGLDDNLQVSGPGASPTRYSAVATGGFHTCALDENGRSRCWGSDALGQVSGAAADAGRSIAISAGYNHTCALRADGRLWCWGWDAFAQSSGPTSDPGAFGPPGPDCNDGNPCTDDLCNGATGCLHLPNTASCDDHSACTASDACGQGVCHAGTTLNCDDGNPCTDDSCNPLAGCVHAFHTRSCDDANPCTQGDACAAGACAGSQAPNGTPCSDGNACTVQDHCQSGACAAGPAAGCDDSNPCTDDACVPASGCTHQPNLAVCDDGNTCTFTDICSGGVCGLFHPSAALAAGAAATCAVRQTGAVSCWGFNYDGQVSGPSTSSGPYIGVTAGYLHTCGVGQSGTLKCWGWDEDGQVSGPNQSAARFVAVAAGYAHTCGVNTAGGLACWGQDSDGQVAGPNATAASFTALATGAFHTCAVTAGGALACWGWNEDGQVAGPNGATGPFREVTGGYAHTCALRVNGRIACWGSNSHGQVAGPNTDSGAYTALGAGWSHTCAVALDGRIHCWGNDAGGQVSGPNASTKRYVAVAAGADHTCALGVDSRVTCWGSDDYGRVSGPNAGSASFGPGVRDCDDLNPCTDDACDAALGCRFVPDNTNACASPDPCQPAVCQSGQCLSGTASDTDGDAVCDLLDNCVSIFNPDQDDQNADGLGNACAVTRINFATPASAVPATFRQDVGAAFDPALGYGWSAGVSTRERITARPLEYDTFAFTQPERHWITELRNGDYDLRVVSGDPSFAQGPHRIRANGVAVIADLATGGDQFIDVTVRVPVRNGRINLAVGGSAGNTLVNFLVATAVPDRPAYLRSINFQPAAAPRPDGWEVNAGLPFDAARGFGWNLAKPTRDRGFAVPQVQDTFAFTTAASTWELSLPNGSYDVSVSVGDAGFPEGPQRVVTEGTVLINNESTSAGSFIERHGTVTVADGRLTLAIGGAGGNTCINYVTVQSLK